MFRLRLFEGHWQLQEIRTAPDRWEQLEVIARAAKVEMPAGECDTPAVCAESRQNSRQSSRVVWLRALFGVTLPSDDVRIKEISPFGLSIGKESAALVTALVRADFRLAQNAMPGVSQIQERHARLVQRLESSTRDRSSQTLRCELTNCQ